MLTGQNVPFFRTGVAHDVSTIQNPQYLVNQGISNYFAKTLRTFSSERWCILNETKVHTRPLALQAPSAPAMHTRVRARTQAQLNLCIYWKGLCRRISCHFGFSQCRVTKFYKTRSEIVPIQCFSFL